MVQGALKDDKLSTNNSKANGAFMRSICDGMQTVCFERGFAFALSIPSGQQLQRCRTR